MRFNVEAVRYVVIKSVLINAKREQRAHLQRILSLEIQMWDKRIHILLQVRQWILVRMKNYWMRLLQGWNIIDKVFAA